MALQEGGLLRERYQIRRIIKSGGMGSVYEALDRNLNSPCAVKEMLEVVARGDEADLIRRKFRAEAEMLVRLEHPGIPRVRDFFTDGQVCYIVMDLVHGANLEQELADCQALTGRPFLPEVLVKDMLQVLDVLVYLHGLEPPVIHRDIKPANIIREFKSGRVKLVDFGLARSADASHSQTMIGTLGYCPLEQMQGRAEPRSDVYALGVTMHQLLTGCIPAVLALEPLDKVAPELDQVLADIIRKATAHDPQQRFASIAEMRLVMGRWRPGGPAAQESVLIPSPAGAGLAQPSPARTNALARETTPVPRETTPVPRETTSLPRETNPKTREINLLPVSSSQPGCSTSQLGLAGLACLVFLLLGLFIPRSAAAPPPVTDVTVETPEVAEETDSTPAADAPASPSPQPPADLPSPSLAQPTPLPAPSAAPPPAAPVHHPQLDSAPAYPQARVRPSAEDEPAPSHPATEVSAVDNGPMHVLNWPEVRFTVSLPTSAHVVANQGLHYLEVTDFDLRLPRQHGTMRVGQGRLSKVYIQIESHAVTAQEQMFQEVGHRLAQQGWSIVENHSQTYNTNGVEREYPNAWHFSLEKPANIAICIAVVRKDVNPALTYSFMLEGRRPEGPLTGKIGIPGPFSMLKDLCSIDGGPVLPEPTP